MKRSRLPHRSHLAFLLLGCVLLSPPSYAIQDIKSNATARNRGIELYRQQRIPEAIATLRSVVAADKQDHEAWYYLGLAQIQKPALKAAAKSFETALALQPKFALAHAAYAYVLAERNKISEAARAARTAIELDATIADAYYVLGMTRWWSGAITEAIENADKAIKLRPDFAPSYLLKAQALVAFVPESSLPEPEQNRRLTKERYARAIEALEKYLQLAANAPNKEFWRGQVEGLKAYAAEHPATPTRQIFTSSQVSTRARVLKKPEPSYTTAARDHGVVGTVVLRAVFAAEGTVKYIFVIRGLPGGLTEASIAAAKKIKFVPATVDGRPVSMWMQLEYNFNLF